MASTELLAADEGAGRRESRARGADGGESRRPHRGRWRGRLRRLLLPTATVVVVLALVDVGIRLGVITSQLPLVTDVIATMWRMVTSASIWIATWQTLWACFAGLLLAFVTAVPLGVLLASRPLVWRAVRVPVEFLRPIPSAAILPLFILMFGTSQTGTVALVFYGSFWVLLMQTLYGVLDVEPTAVDTGRAYGLSPLQRFWRIVVPSTLPYIATGLRLSVAFALLGAVMKELVVGGSVGLGYQLALAQQGSNMTLMFAITAFIGLIGMALNALVTIAEARVLRWHTAHRPKE